MVAGCRAYPVCVTLLLLAASRAAPASTSLDTVLEPIREANRLPALAAAVALNPAARRYERVMILALSLPSTTSILYPAREFDTIA